MKCFVLQLYDGLFFHESYERTALKLDTSSPQTKPLGCFTVKLRGLLPFINAATAATKPQVKKLTGLSRLPHFLSHPSSKCEYSMTAVVAYFPIPVKRMSPMPTACQYCSAMVTLSSMAQCRVFIIGIKDFVESVFRRLHQESDPRELFRVIGQLRIQRGIVVAVQNRANAVHVVSVPDGIKLVIDFKFGLFFHSHVGSSSRN
jgi:hypothetical protein